MAEVKLQLKNKKLAPWGLLTDEDKPRMIVWLTEENPYDTVDDMVLSFENVDQIKKDKADGIIEVNGGMFEEELDLNYPTIDQIDVFDVAEQTQEEIKPPVPSFGEERAKEILSKKVTEALKFLKAEVENPNAAPGYLVDFLGICRQQESMGKARKRIISFLVKAIEKEIHNQRLAIDQSGSNARLEKQYERLIEEE